MDSLLKKGYYFTFIFSIIFLINGCLMGKTEYSYLSEIDKEYLFYDIGDSLLFIHNTDTLYGYVTEKLSEIRQTSMGGIVEFNDYYIEVCELKIFTIDNFDKEIVNIRLSAKISYSDSSASTASLIYDFSNEGIIYDIDSCEYQRIRFGANLRDGELYTTTPQYGGLGPLDGYYQPSVKMDSIAEDIFQFTSQSECSSGLEYYLQLSKTEGFILINNSESDTLFIEQL